MRGRRSMAVLFPQGKITTSRRSNRLPGEISAVEPPDPIPNSEVKRSCADGSVAQAMRE